MQAVLASLLPAQARVWVFGSRAKWTTKDTSDLDLAIDAGRALTLRELGALGEAFEESDLPYRVDIVDMHTVSDGFREIIERDRVAMPQLPGTSAWRTTKLGEFVRLQRGHDLTEAERKPGRVPVFGSAGQNGFHNEALAKGPGVVIGRSGDSMGVVSYARADFWPHNTVLYVTDFLGNCPRFAYYFLGCLNLRRFDSGSAQASLNRNFVYPMQIEVPGRDEQESIASVLGALDDKIELNRRMNETLEAMARAIFKDWFVDFGPTRAKMEGRAPYLAPDIWSLFPDRLDDEGKPEGWSNSTIGQEVDVVGGSTPSTKESVFWGGDIAWATPKDLSSLSTPVLLGTERSITDAGLSQIGSGLLPVGTVLLSSRAPIGYMAISQIPVAVNQGFIAMVCKKRLSKVFVWLWTQANMEAVHQNANGSTFQEISKANFRPIPMTVAIGDILGAFDEVVVPLFERIVANEREDRTLAATRDLLLPKLMSGEVRVREASGAVEHRLTEAR